MTGTVPSSPKPRGGPTGAQVHRHEPALADPADRSGSIRSERPSKTSRWDGPR